MESTRFNVILVADPKEQVRRMIVKSPTGHRPLNHGRNHGIPGVDMDYHPPCTHGPGECYVLIDDCSICPKNSSRQRTDTPQTGADCGLASDTEYFI